MYAPAHHGHYRHGKFKGHKNMHYGGHYGGGYHQRRHKGFGFFK
jgi:hypothetical protein